MFHVLLNNMPVIADLDIYSRVGKAVAYDEVVPFSVDRGQLFVSDGSVDFDGTLSIQFMKVSRDKKFSRGGGGGSELPKIEGGRLVSRLCRVELIIAISGGRNRGCIAPLLPLEKPG